MKKPKHCGQQWMDMKPIGGGRLCGQCDKVIYDFSKMTWSQISELQRLNSNSLCGMYQPKQITHWGHEPPGVLNNCKSVVASIAMLLAASANLNGQANNTVTLTGSVTTETGEPVIYANVIVFSEDRSFLDGVISDFDGNYSIAVDSSAVKIEDLKMEVSYIGLPTQRCDSILVDHPNHVILDSTEVAMDVFYVRKPTFWQRIGTPFRRWFGRH